MQSELLRSRLSLLVLFFPFLYPVTAAACLPTEGLNLCCELSLNSSYNLKRKMQTTSGEQQHPQIQIPFVALNGCLARNRRKLGTAEMQNQVPHFFCNIPSILLAIPRDSRENNKFYSSGCDCSWRRENSFFVIPVFVVCLMNVGQIERTKEGIVVCKTTCQCK